MTKGERFPTEDEVREQKLRELQDSGVTVERRNDGEIFIGGLPIPPEMIKHLRLEDTRDTIGRSGLRGYFGKR